MIIASNVWPYLEAHSEETLLCDTEGKGLYIKGYQLV